MTTVQEILKQSVLNDEQIAALDAKAITAFTGVLTTAEQAQQSAQEIATKTEQERQIIAKEKELTEQERQAAVKEKEAAELAKRANDQFYGDSIVPALNTWGTEKANMEAQIAFYKTQNEAARASGFVPAEAPNFAPQSLPAANAQQRDGQGRYVAAAPGSIPGSPTFTMEDVRNGLGSTLGTLTDIQWKYQSLYGKPMPISPTDLVRQAEAVKLDPSIYAARTFQFAEKEAEIAHKVAEDHDAKIRAEATAPFETKLAEAEALRQKALQENDRKWAEKIGNNPDVRIAQPSRFADVARAVKAGERPDPLVLNDSQRRMSTQKAIHAEIAENAA